MKNYHNFDQDVVKQKILEPKYTVRTIKAPWDRLSSKTPNSRRKLIKQEKTEIWNFSFHTSNSWTLKLKL